MKSLEQSVRILSRKFNRERNENTTPTVSLPPSGESNKATSKSEDKAEDGEVKAKEEAVVIAELSRTIAYEDEEGDFIESLPELERPKGLSEKKKKIYAIEISRPVRRSKTNGRYNVRYFPCLLHGLMLANSKILSIPQYRGA